MSKFKLIMKVVLIIFGLAILIFGIPIIINECYKVNCGYVVAWDAGTMLGYYGTILGTVATIVALVITILFTKKQIQRESFLRNENEKWTKIESVFLEIIEGINPLMMLQDIMDNGFTNPSKAINILQKYQMKCKSACDVLNSHLNVVDYPKVKQLIEGINSTAEELIGISNEEEDLYSKLQLLQHKKHALEMLEIEKKQPGAFSKEDISFNQEILEKIKNINYENISQKIIRCNDKIVKIYQVKYIALLQSKGATFEVIHEEIKARAEAILSIRKNRNEKS